MLKIIGLTAVVGACYLITHLIVGGTFRHRVEADRSAKHYLGRANPAIFTYWSFEEFDQRVAGELRVSRGYHRIKDYFANAKRKLGSPLKFGEISGEITDISELGLSGEVISAAYSQKLEFESGSAQLTMSLIRREGGWKYQKLSILAEGLGEMETN